MAGEESREDVYALGEIVVTGQKGGVESVSTIQEVTAREIKNRGARGYRINQVCFNTP